MSHIDKSKVRPAESNIPRTVINGLHSVVDFVFILIMVFLLLFAGWAKWDSKQVYTAADPVQYLQYKPTPPYVVSFEELQGINSDVLGWITVYDTNIDYPLVQDESGNEYYLDHNPKGEVETSGSVFLDYRNKDDFTDFNTIIYGHHMAEHKMFGDLDEFLDRDFFDSHEYGNLIYGNENHGLRFVAMLEVDAYDSVIYTPGLRGTTAKEDYIRHLYDSSIYIRGVDVSKIKASKIGRRQEPIKSTDHLVLLSTCSEDITNGRFVLVAKVLDHPVENPFPEKEHRISSGIDTTKIVYTIGRLNLTTWIVFLTVLILCIIIALRCLKQRRVANQRRRKNE